MDPANIPVVLKLQMQLAVLAFACDLTRVISLTAAQSGGGYRTYGFIPGVSGSSDWHGLSHAVETGDVEPMTSVCRWHSEMLAILIDGLKSNLDSDGSTLLKNSLVWVNNEYGPNGEVPFLPISPVTGTRPNLSHWTRLMPFLLLGQAASWPLP